MGGRILNLDLVFEKLQFFATLSHFLVQNVQKMAKRSKELHFFQKLGPNSKFCFLQFVNIYPRSILAKFGTKILKNVGDPIFVIL